MGISKVVLEDETLIDLTSDSVSSENLLEGATAHGADGEKVIGGVVAFPLINNFLTNQPGVGAADANTVYTLKNEVDGISNKLLCSVGNSSMSDTLENMIKAYVTNETLPAGEVINRLFRPSDNDTALFNVTLIRSLPSGTYSVLAVSSSNSPIVYAGMGNISASSLVLERLDNKINKTDLISQNLTTISTKVDFNNSDAYFGYSVKNGMCTVSLWSMKILEACNIESLVVGLPKPMGGRPVAQHFASPANGILAFVWVSGNGVLNCNAPAVSVGKSGYATIVYPVEE